MYELVKLIPKGRVTTYGAIAKALGTARSSRLVGTAMILAHDPKTKCSHPSSSKSTGITHREASNDSPTQMQELLENEGIAIENDQVKDFDEIFWDPFEEL